MGGARKEERTRRRKRGREEKRREGRKKKEIMREMTPIEPEVSISQQLSHVLLFQVTNGLRAHEIKGSEFVNNRSCLGMVATHLR